MNKKINAENNPKSATKTISLGKYIFEVVESVPPGYEIWKIGSNMINGYLPLCRLSAYQPFPGGKNIETDTLKAIRIDGAQAILAAVSGGQDTIQKMEEYLRENRRAKPGTWAYAQLRRIKRALPIMHQIKWC